MTALTTPAAAPAATSSAGPEPRARFRDLLAAEWIKLWSLRSTSWVFGISALAVTGINVNAASADYSNWPSYGASIRASFDPYWAMRDAFTRPACLVLMLAAGSIGAIAIVSEYSTGLIRTTFAAVPARRSVMAAKFSVVTAVLLVFGTVIAAASFGVTQAILSGRHVGLSIAYPGALRLVAASALLAPVSAAIGMGIGALIRHSASTIIITTAVLLLLPILIDSQIHQWVMDLHNAMPMPAWERLVFPGNPAFGGRQATITGSWLVFALWPLTAVILAMTAVHRRDVGAASPASRPRRPRRRRWLRRRPPRLPARRPARRR
jgi:ABC-2 type transport system permease protein